MKKIYYLLIKKSMYIIYIFSNTYLYGLFFLATLFVAFSDVENNSLLLLCKLLVYFLLTGSFLLFVILNIKSFFDSLGNLLGDGFINAYFPLSRNSLRAGNPFVIFWLTLLFLYVTDYGTLIWFQHQQTEILTKLANETCVLVDQNMPMEASKVYEKTLQVYNKTPQVRGCFEQLVNSNPVKYFLNFFTLNSKS